MKYAFLLSMTVAVAAAVAASAWVPPASPKKHHRRQQPNGQLLLLENTFAKKSGLNLGGDEIILYGLDDSKQDSIFYSFVKERLHKHTELEEAFHDDEKKKDLAQALECSFKKIQKKYPDKPFSWKWLEMANELTVHIDKEAKNIMSVDQFCLARDFFQFLVWTKISEAVSFSLPNRQLLLPGNGPTGPFERQKSLAGGVDLGDEIGIIETASKRDIIFHRFVHERLHKHREFELTYNDDVKRNYLAEALERSCEKVQRRYPDESFDTKMKEVSHELKVHIDEDADITLIDQDCLVEDFFCFIVATELSD